MIQNNLRTFYLENKTELYVCILCHTVGAVSPLSLVIFIYIYINLLLVLT